jgi:sec-independent protein translocase protein TatA
MNITLAGFFGGWEIVLILAVVLILFGAKKLPELAKGLGQGIKEFKKASREVQEEINSAVEAEPEPPRKTTYSNAKTLPEPAKPESETAATVPHTTNEPRT